MSRWFRHYAGMMRDEKLVRVAIKSKQPVERVLWIWGAILESASEIDDNGRYDLDPAEVAYFLRADEADVCAVIAGLEDAGRLASAVVVHWGDRQYTSDRSRERQAAYRERKRKQIRHGDSEKDADDGDVTSPDRHGDGEVTPQETETETETDIQLPDGNCRSAPTAADITKSIFDTGVTILTATGRDDRQARSIMGRWRKQYSDSQVLTVLSRCQAEQPSEPVEWITKTLRAEANHGKPASNDEIQNPYVRAAFAQQSGRASAEWG